MTIAAMKPMKSQSCDENYPQQCANCQSSRRPVKAIKLCAKCYYWKRNIADCNAKLAGLAKLPKEKQGSRPVSLKFRIQVAQRSLEELKWREEGLNVSPTSAWKLRSLVCTIARDCGSTVEEASLQDLETIDPSARKIIYRALLEVVETLPRKWPSLHTGLRPEKRFRSFRGGWGDWQNEYWSRKFVLDSAH